MAMKKRATTRRTKRRTKPRAKKVWYKVIDSSGHSSNGGDYEWDLPKRNKPGAWTTELSSVQICRYGYHLVPKHGIREWVDKGEELYIAEPKPGATSQIRERDDDGKACFSSVRLVKKVGAFPDWLFESDDNGDSIYHSLTDDELLQSIEGRTSKMIKRKLLARQTAEQKLIDKYVSLVHAADQLSSDHAVDGQFIAGCLTAHKIKTDDELVEKVYQAY